MESVLQTYQISPTTILYAVVFLFIVGVLIGIGFVLSKSAVLSTPANIQRIGDTRLPEFENLLTTSIKDKTSLTQANIPYSQKTLVNFVPLTVYNPGYVGPIDNGVYKEAESVAATLKAGARCFVLPIDYHENSTLPKPQFPDAGEPCLLYRDAGGTIRSLNAGSIQKVAEALGNLAFNDSVPLKSDPLLVILYFVRTPQENTKEYLRYCSKVAKQLTPLQPFFLGQAPEGVYNRQARQDELLYTPLQNLEKRVIVMSNIDTNLFRNPKSVGVSSVPTQEDLDFFVNLRLFSPIDPPLGATQRATQNQFARGYIETLQYSLLVPENKSRDTVETNRIRWIVNLSNEVPKLKDIKYAIEKMGVQCIPLPLYALSEGDKPILDLWKKGWIVKPDALRFTQPEPIQPKEPSPKMNANKGQVSSPTL